MFATYVHAKDKQHENYVKKTLKKIKLLGIQKYIKIEKSERMEVFFFCFFISNKCLTIANTSNQ